jgi:hypothetical protein
MNINTIPVAKMILHLAGFERHFMHFPNERKYSNIQVVHPIPAYPFAQEVFPYPPSKQASEGKQRVKLSGESNDRKTPLPTKGNEDPFGQFTPSISGHFMHDELPAAPIMGLQKPRSQFKHSILALELVYFPAGHFKHDEFFAVDPKRLTLPKPQSKHIVCK